MDSNGDQPPPITYDLDLLESSQAKWRRSAGLRTVYGSIFAGISSRMVDGPALELGSGIGNIKSFIPEVVTSDLIKTGHVDIACSAYDIRPPESGQWANIIAVDMLHHLCRPMDFFHSAAGVLRDDGRIILVEPAATAFGRAFYTLFHAEPIQPSCIQPPFEMAPDNEDGEYANMGMGISLFRLKAADCNRRLAALGLETVEVAYRDLLAYPLSGGYSGPQMAPAFLLRRLLAVERFLPQVLLRWLALRMVIVIRKLPREPLPEVR